MVTALLIVIVTDSLTGPQDPEGSADLNVNVTVLAAISEAVGVYVALRAFLPGTKIPPPPNHSPVDTVPVTDPFNVTDSFEQIV
jgi:hypothetical protein